MEATLDRERTLIGNIPVREAVFVVTPDNGAEALAFENLGSHRSPGTALHYRHAVGGGTITLEWDDC